MLAPGPLDDTRVDSRIGAGASRRIDLAQPLRKRNAESLLGAVEDRRVEVARERLAQQIFAASVAKLEPVRQARAELDEVVVEHHRPGFQAHQHRRAVGLEQDVGR